VSTLEFQLVRAGAFALALAAAATAQRLAPHARHRGSLRVNAALWALDAAIVGLVCGACALTAADWAARRGLGLANALAAPWWVAMPVGVLGLDFASYFWHRANHEVAALWRFHRVHHSDPSFTVSTGLRFHPGELLLSLPVRLLAVVLLGAPAAGVLAFEAVFAFANLIEHGDIDLPPRLERGVGRLVVTPALHRLHHSRLPAERDRNFGTILIVWDRLLGTYRPSSSAARVAVGLDETGAPRGLWAVLLLPLAPR
jgi:sterol desaturase/sphingolipid hydroxylase (fatty acid hydroxylase superfamily)